MHLHPTSRDLSIASIAWYPRAVGRCYHQYCPIAHALDLVGERWSLLVVRELNHGPLRYTDLLERLHGVSTNVLAARLRQLEADGVVARRTLPPPAASAVYELTELGLGLGPVLGALAHWGARSLGPPTADSELVVGWLERALRTAVGTAAPAGSFEFHAGDEVASIVDGHVTGLPAVDPDVVVHCDAAGIYSLIVDGRVASSCTTTGDRERLAELAEAVSARHGTATSVA